MKLNYAVITACLNSEQTIEKSIKSVLSQQVLPKQYIFVDGGSYDNTKNIINKWEKNIKENNIHFDLLNQKSNGGIYEAWNMALSIIRGEIDLIFILNSDDWYSEKAVQYVMEVFYNNENVDILCAASKDYYTNQTSKINKVKKLKLFPILMPIVHPACFVKKEVYDKIGYFNTKFKVSGDYEFLYRAYLNKQRFFISNQITTNRMMGGWAETHKKMARKETFTIGKTYSKFKVLPYAAFFMRKFLGR